MKIAIAVLLGVPLLGLMGCTNAKREAERAGWLKVRASLAAGYQVNRECREGTQIEEYRARADQLEKECEEVRGAARVWCSGVERGRASDFDRYMKRENCKKYSEKLATSPVCKRAEEARELRDMINEEFRSCGERANSEIDAAEKEYMAACQACTSRYQCDANFKANKENLKSEMYVQACSRW